VVAKKRKLFIVVGENGGRLSAYSVETGKDISVVVENRETFSALSAEMSKICRRNRRKIVSAFGKKQKISRAISENGGKDERDCQILILTK